MQKVIRSQDGLQIHFMPANTPCYFNVAPVVADGKAEGAKDTLYSVGINNVSFGIFKKKGKAEAVIDDVEKFLLNKTMRFQIPADG